MWHNSMDSFVWFGRSFIVVTFVFSLINALLWDFDKAYPVLFHANGAFLALIVVWILKAISNSSAIKIPPIGFWGLALSSGYFLAQAIVFSFDVGGFHLVTMLGTCFWSLPFIASLVYYTNNYSKPEHDGYFGLWLLCASAFLITIPSFVNSLYFSSLQTGRYSFFSYSIASFLYSYCASLVLIIPSPISSVLFVVMCGLILFSKKRGALLMLSVAMAAVSAVSVKKILHFPARFVLIAMAILIGGGVWFSTDIDTVIMRFSEDSDVKSEHGAGSGRTEIWDYHLRSYMAGDVSSQLLGFGPTASMQLMDKKRGLASSAHNTYIGILYQFGALGLGVYLIYLASMVRVVVRVMLNSGKYSNLLLYILVYVVGLGFTEYLFENYMSYFWILIFWSVAGNELKLISERMKGCV